MISVAYEAYPLIMLAIMEVPAIIIGLLLVNKGAEKKKNINWGKIIHKAMTNGSVVLFDRESVVERNRVVVGV